MIFILLVMMSSCIGQENEISNSPVSVQFSITTDNVLANKVNTYLSEYFPNGEYELLSEKLNVKFREISFAVHYINKSDPKICDIVVGFEYVDGIFHRYLLISDFKFINEDNSILLDFSKGYSGIYGFNFYFSYPQAAGYSPGLNIDTYFDAGETIADTFTIMWNEDKREFEDVDWL
jgi:hypothetical protein